jgi:iron complex outermembrane receptor protein
MAPALWAAPSASCRTRLNPSGFDAKVEAGMSDTVHTEAPNEDVNGMINMPLTDTFAIRANAGLTNDAGFINQPNLYALDGSGVPIAAQPGNLFSPPEIIEKKGRQLVSVPQRPVLPRCGNLRMAFKAELSYYYQTGDAAGYPYIATNPAGYNRPINPANLPVGPFTNPPALTQLYNLPAPPGIDQLSSPENIPDSTHDLVDMVALSVEYDMGFATLTSATSWARHSNSSLADETAEYENFGNFPQDLYGQNPRMLVIGEEAFIDKPWSQELRLASKLGGFLDWVGGLFFKHQTNDVREDDFYPGYNAFYNACEPIYGPSPGDFATPSYCGVGDTSYTPGKTTVINGIPVLQNELYVGNFQNTFKDLCRVR